MVERTSQEQSAPTVIPPSRSGIAPRAAPIAIDYRSSRPLPSSVRQIIEAGLAIEAEDAKAAGTIGFMTRALVNATMPYKNPKKDVFERANGDFRLRMVAGYGGGLPYGIYPRLLLSWISTEAVRTQSPLVELGSSLRAFLRDVLELRSYGGGERGSGHRVTDQMKRLFGTLITAQYTGPLNHRGFTLNNILIAEEVHVEAATLDLFSESPPRESAPASTGTDGQPLWTPQPAHEAGQWRSRVRLSDTFYRECVTHPVPVDLRAYKALRGSPLAMDIYTWLTFRMSYTVRRSRPIRWELLMNQFGSQFNDADIDQAVRNFKKQFLKALKLVVHIYAKARLEVCETGLVLLPSPPHVLPAKNTSPLA